MQEENVYCCKLMYKFLEDKRIPIRYDPVFREYFIPLRGSSAVQGIFHCPWCGAELPQSLRNEYYEILEKEYNIDHNMIFLHPKSLPKEFQSDEWWKKRRQELETKKGHTPIEKRNILSDVCNGLITEEEAAKIYQELFNQFHTQKGDCEFLDMVGMNMREYNAYLISHMSFATIAKWHFEGWPSICQVCKKAIDYENEGWLALKAANINNVMHNNVVIHRKCKSKLQKP